MNAANFVWLGFYMAIVLSTLVVWNAIPAFTSDALGAINAVKWTFFMAICCLGSVKVADILEEARKP